MRYHGLLAEDHVVCLNHDERIGCEGHGARLSLEGLWQDAANLAHSSIRRADCNDFHLADGVVHPPNNGMGTENGHLPVSAVRSKGCKVTLL